LAGATIADTHGRLRIAGVDVASLGPDGKFGPSRRLACDCLLMSGGFTPSIHLFSQSGGKPGFDAALQAFLPVERDGQRSAGACRGVFGAQFPSPPFRGERQGEVGPSARTVTPPPHPDPLPPEGRRGSNSPPHSLDAALADGRSGGVPTATDGGFLGALPQGHEVPQIKAFVDFQNDVTVKDIKLAIREGFRSIEHIKRYTTTGMATDQGKTSNMNALGIIAAALDRPIPQVGLTTFRPPYSPVSFGTFAGLSREALFDPVRTTPIHGWAAAQGAVFEDVSLWKRARFFPKPGEDMHAAVARECLAVRHSLGIFDASTLGKIEVVGPDAAEFMNRIYVNPWTKLEPGRCRYGVMLREDGFILDDGVVGRLAADRFHVTTTTGGAARVLNLMEDYLQTEWPDLDVWLTSTTEQWAVIALQGPNARKFLEPLIEAIDLSPAAMPHMSVRSGRICGVPTRLFRVSFTGELGFEVNVPADHGRAIWEALWDAGQPLGITPYGTEAMHVLRAEKGYIIVGQETDGTATPDDVGLSWAVGKTKRDFVGKRSLARAEMRNPERKQLVGLLTEEPGFVLEDGAQLVVDPRQAKPMTMLGHVTSSYFSPILGRSIALAMIRGGRARIGQTLHVPLPDRSVAVTLVDPVFYDPAGARLDA
jgi:sarcosine oxidase subunit alpha